MRQLKAKRYAKAILEAVTEKQLPSVLNTLGKMAEAFYNSEFQAIIDSPEIKEEEKDSLVLSLAGKKPNAKIVNLIKTLSLHKRLNLIPDIVYLLNKEMQRRKNQYEGIVESSAALQKSEIEALEKSLSKYVDAKVVLKTEVGDHEGIKVMIEDLGLEASFSKERLASQMIDHILKAL